MSIGRYLYNKLNLSRISEPEYLRLLGVYTNNTFSALSPNSSSLIFMCNGLIRHGGLTDREKGLLTVYFLAKITKRNFKINWVSPFRLEEYLVPNSYNWLPSLEEITYDKSNIDILIFHLFNTKEYIKRNIFNYLINLWWILKNKKTKHIYTNFNFPKSQFPKLYNELFKPSVLLEVELQKHKSKIGDKYWAFSFRFRGLLGDFNECDCGILEEKDKVKLINKNLFKLKELLNTLPKEYKCFITSDSTTFIKLVKNVDARVYCIDGEISHIDIGTSSNENYLNLFVSQYLLMSAEKIFRLRTGKMYKSGFPEFAALIGGKEFIDVDF